MASILVAVVGVCTITMSVKGGGVVKPHLCSKIKGGARVPCYFRNVLPTSLLYHNNKNKNKNKK
jgi:hypothetical protein